MYCRLQIQFRRADDLFQKLPQSIRGSFPVQLILLDEILRHGGLGQIYLRWLLNCLPFPASCVVLVLPARAAGAFDSDTIVARRQQRRSSEYTLPSRWDRE